MRSSDRFTQSDIYSYRRLFRDRRYASAQTPAVQDAIRLQLAYWRSLGRQQFTRLTTLDMVHNIQPIYHPCQLTYNELFLTFSSITPLAAHQSRLMIASYLHCMYPNAIRIALCREIHPQTQNVHYHCYVQFPHAVYVILNAGNGGNLSFNKRLFPNYLVQPVYKAEKALAYIAKEDPDAVDWKHGDYLPEYHLEPLVQEPPVQQLPPPHIPSEQSSSEHLPETLLTLDDLLTVYQHGTLETLVQTMLAMYEPLGLKKPEYHAATFMLKLLKKKRT